MVKNLTKPIPILSTNASSGIPANLVKPQNVSSLLYSLVGVLESSRKFWSAVENKPKTLLLKSSSATLGSIVCEGKYFHLTLGEDGLKDLTGEKLEFSEIALETENTD